MASGRSNETRDRAEALSFAAVRAVLAREVDAATPASRLWLDLHLDEVALHRVHAVIEEVDA